jgi:protein TonB
MRQTPSTNLKLQYKKVLEFGLLISLILHILLLQGYKKVGERKMKLSSDVQIFQVEEIPQTERERNAPAPSRPSVPIASEDESLPDDETIEFTELDLDDEPPLPPPPLDTGAPMFFAYDDAPVPIGGWGELKNNLVYPPMAQKANVEGKVVVNAEIDEKGNVGRTWILKSLVGCDEAAVKAIRKTKWKPAMQRDQPVRVRVAITVVFELN